MSTFLNLLTADLTGTVLVLFGLALFLHLVGAARSQMTDTDEDPVTEARHARSE